MSYPKNYTKEYFITKNRQRRQNNPLLRKKYVYCVEINGKEYVFLQKSKIKFQKKDIKSVDFDNIIKCF